VKGVHATDLDRSSRCHQGLGRHLSAKRALTLLFGVSTSKSIDLDCSRSSKSTSNTRASDMFHCCISGLRPRGSTPKRN